MWYEKISVASNYISCAFTEEQKLSPCPSDRSREEAFALHSGRQIDRNASWYSTNYPL